MLLDRQVDTRNARHVITVSKTDYCRRELDIVAGLAAAREPPKRPRPGPRTAGSTTPQVGLLEQALVLVRDQMSLDLGREIHDHDDDDQQRRAAEIERTCQALRRISGTRQTTTR